MEESLYFIADLVDGEYLGVHEVESELPHLGEFCEGFCELVHALDEGVPSNVVIL